MGKLRNHQIWLRDYIWITESRISTTASAKESAWDIAAGLLGGENRRDSRSYCVESYHIASRSSFIQFPWSDIGIYKSADYCESTSVHIPLPELRCADVLFADTRQFRKGYLETCNTFIHTHSINSPLVWNHIRSWTRRDSLLQFALHDILRNWQRTHVNRHS